ncbi:hypothetical protein LQV05_002074 [Cryptococcus neoformans]|nr:hypothetical protein LQV05_002074 [Cryptococcus neoformans]
MDSSRHNLHGLPPTYLAHLKALLHQWLTQQTTPAGDSKLWSEKRVAQIERAIWEGAVLTSAERGSRRESGILEQNWEGWIGGSTKRKSLWKEETRQEEEKIKEDEKTEAHASRKSSMGDRDRGRLRLMVAQAGSTASTPSNASPRASSVASTERRQGTDSAPRDVNKGKTPEQSDQEKLQEWCRIVSTLDGYEPLSLAKADGWEDINTDRVPKSTHQHIPGSFPQSGLSIEYRHSLDNPSQSKGTFSTLGLPSSPPKHDPSNQSYDLLKPVFCLHFPIPHSSRTSTKGLARKEGSQSTIRIRRDPSVSARSASSAGSSRWWGSGNKWGDILGSPFLQDDEEERVEVDFVQGRFALPSDLFGSPALERRESKKGRVAKRKRRRSIFSALEVVSSSLSTNSSLPSESTSDTTSEAESGLSDTDTDDEQSGKEIKRRIPSRRHRPLSLILSGAEDDIPRSAAEEGKIRLVGGTIVVKGLRGGERKALGEVLKALIWTIGMMKLELDLYTAFRLPHEPDPSTTFALDVSSSVPLIHPALSPQTSNPTPHPSGEVSRSSSLREKDRSRGQESREGKKGFLSKLGKNTKGVWNGLLGRKGSARDKSHGQSDMGGEEYTSPILSPTLPSESSPSSPLFPSQPLSSHLHSPSLSSPSSFPRFKYSSYPKDPSPDSNSSFHTNPNINTDANANANTNANPPSQHLQTLSTLSTLLPSSTPGLKYPMPPILLRIQEEERIRREKTQKETLAMSENSNGSGDTSGNTLRGRAMAYRPGGDVRSGLHVLAAGIDTLAGWTMLQLLCVLYCVGLPSPVSGSKSGSIANGGEQLGEDVRGEADEEKDGEGEICESPQPQFLPPTLTIGDYLQHLGEELGENLLCTRSGCEKEVGQHVRWYVHAGVKVGVRIENVKVKEDGGRDEDGVREDEDEGAVAGKAEDGQDVEGWVKCIVCREESEPRQLNEGALAYPWSKLLELLIYTPHLQPPICDHHTTPHAYITLFRTSSYTASLTSSPVKLYDVRLPKLQIGPNIPKRKAGGGRQGMGLMMDDEKEGENALKREVTRWCEALDDRIDILREKIEREYEAAKELSEGPEKSGPGLQEKFDTLLSLSTIFTAFKDNSLESISSTPQDLFNDLRISFSAFIRSSLSEIEAWEKKYLPENAEEGLETMKEMIPEYAKEGGRVHALPGSGVLVKEDEPASVVAYTLSSLAYLIELTNTSKPADDSNPATAITTPRDPTDSSLPTAPTTGAGTPTSASTPSGSGWSTKIEHRDSPRDLLSLRSIVKKKSDASVSLDKAKSTPPALGLSTLSGGAPSLELNLEKVEGVSEGVEGRDRLEEIAKAVGKATGQEMTLGTTTAHAVPSSLSRRASMTESDTSSSSGVRLSSQATKSSQGPPSSFRPIRSVSSTPISRSPMSPLPTATRSPASGATTTSTLSPNTAISPGARDSSWDSVTSSFVNSVNNLWKLGSEMGETFSSMRSRPRDQSLKSLMGPLSSMDNSLSTLSPRPHLHFTYAFADKLRLSCTVYFATAFDTLRRRCAIDKVLVQSLERTEVWDAQGGKSKAGFWMTKDKRFIVKELLSKWTVSDMHALLEISPAYFHHMAGTHNRATALAKIVGFYTVTIKDSQCGQKRQLDLLVMENLFHNQNILKTFDLKGIGLEGRRVAKTKEGDKEVKSTTTQFDADWLEGMQKGLVLLQPHAKRILLDAISLDTRFLSSQSIMDYSLLLGVDTRSSLLPSPNISEDKLDQERENGLLIVGIVDAIGSFNLFKTIESRGKMVMNRGGDVTVIPPDQYRERFENAIRHYFVACPDKWSKVSRKVGEFNGCEVSSVL